MGKYIILVLVLAIIISAWLLYRKITRQLRGFSQAAFGTASLVQGLKQQEERLAVTPKSVTGMTKIYLPQIMQDFPEFSLPEFIHKSENQLKAALHAVETERLEELGSASADLKEQVRVWIEDNKRQGIREYYRDIEIHQTEIGRYLKQSGSCVITLQSAVGYGYYKGKELPGTGDIKLKQNRYNLHLMYIQDEALLPESGPAFSVVCPQCGAPITGLGNKVCEYCQAAVEPVNIRSWFLTRISEA